MKVFISILVIAIAFVIATAAEKEIKPEPLEKPVVGDKPKLTIESAHPHHIPEPMREARWGWGGGGYGGYHG